MVEKKLPQIACVQRHASMRGGGGCKQDTAVCRIKLLNSSFCTFDDTLLKNITFYRINANPKNLHVDFCQFPRR